MTTTARTITVRPLSDNELRVLDNVTGSAVALGQQGFQAQATVAFFDRRDGVVHVGPVRSAVRHPSPTQPTRFEVVVAGAVFSVLLEDILSVVWGVPVPEHGQPRVTLQVEGRGLLVVDPARAGSLGCVPWNLTVKSAREEQAELARAADDDDEDNECEGHESLRGDSMGVSVFCDGTCR